MTDDVSDVELAEWIATADSPSAKTARGLLAREGGDLGQSGILRLKAALKEGRREIRLTRALDAMEVEPQAIDSAAEECRQVLQATEGNRK